MNPRVYSRIVVMGSTEAIGTQIAEHLRRRTETPVQLFHRRTDFRKLHGDKEASIDTLVIIDEELSGQPTGREIRGLARNGARLDKAVVRFTDEDHEKPVQAVVMTIGERPILSTELSALIKRKPRYYRVIRGNAW